MTRTAEIVINKEILARGINVDISIYLGKLYLQKGEYTEAEKYTSDLLKVEPNNPDAWALLGDICFLKESVKEAMNSYERAHYLYQG